MRSGNFDAPEAGEGEEVPKSLMKTTKSLETAPKWPQKPENPRGLGTEHLGGAPKFLINAPQMFPDAPQSSPSHSRGWGGGRGGNTPYKEPRDSQMYPQIVLNNPKIDRTPTQRPQILQSGTKIHPGGGWEA